MEILLTGANGQLGQDLLPRLKRAGFTPVGLTSSELDVTDASAVAEAFARVRPRAVINCAAYTKVDMAEKEDARAFAVNRDGAAVVAQAASSSGAALIHLSTDFVFDGRTPAPYTEDDGTDPLCVYGKSKLDGELEVRRRVRKHMIVRTSWLYGASGGNFVRTVLRFAAEKETLRIVYDQTGTPTWTVDLAGALVEAVKSIKAGREVWGTYHYSNEGVASWYDFAVDIIEEGRRLGFPIKALSVEPIRTEDYPTPARRPAYSVLDKVKIKRALGVNIPHWRASLKTMLTNLKEREGAGGA